MNAANRVAIVTGGSRGIGRAIVETLASNDTAVVINYAGNRVAADAAVKAIVDVGGQAIAVQGDVADERAIARLFQTAEDTFGGIDAVVHSAGRLMLGKLAELDLDDLDALHRTNIRGTFVVNQQAARRVREGGAIVNLSTSVVKLAFPEYGAYSASKGAMEALIPILARELRGRDINVNAVAPGPTATDLFLEGKDEATLERLAMMPPLERLGTPADIARLVAFLVSPSGHWVNGQVIRANGGIV